MTDTMNDPRSKHPAEEFPAQQQDQPGLTERTDPTPDHGEDSYVGHDRLRGRRALITGGDSGIGRAVAIAFAREGADVAIAHLPEEAKDAEATVAIVEAAGRRGIAFAGDVRDEDFAGSIVTDTVSEFGGIDIVVLNAAYQKDREGLDSLETAELDRVFKTNLYGLIFTARAAVPHLKPGASIIVTSSIQAFNPSPGLIDYAMTKAAQVAFVKALAEELGPKGHPRERGRARADLDAPHPGDRVGQRAPGDVRSGHPARPRRPAGGARRRLCVSGVRRRVVRIGCRAAGDRRKGSVNPAP